METIDVACPSCNINNKVYPKERKVVCANCATSYTFSINDDGKIIYLDKGLVRKSVSVVLTKPQMKKLQDVAKDDLRSLSYIVSKAVSNYLEIADCTKS